MADPLVSVVMAVWRNDRLEFVQQAIESILRQSHTQLQILVVENGPVPADLRDCLEQAAERDPRIELLRLGHNIGPGGARNAAFAVARGEFTAILDADDVAAPERIERQVAFMRKTRADIVGSWYRLIDADGVEVGRKQMPVDAAAVRRCALFINPIANPTVMGRTEALRKHGYRESYLYGEDYYLWIALLRDGRILCNQPEYLLDFRVAPDFLRKRRGLHKFRTDFANKTAALNLYPVIARPFLFLTIPVLASVRLLPEPLLKLFYAARNAVHFRRG